MRARLAARVRVLAAPALLGPSVVCLLGPHTIFTTNPGEFAVGFGAILAPWLLRSAAFNWIVLLGVGCMFALVSERLTRVYAALLLAFGLLLWGQGNVWNADYGVLTGEDIDLVEHAHRAPFELAAWAGVLFLSAVFFRPVSRIAPFAALAFMGVQVAAAALIGTGPAAPARGRWVEPPSSLY